MALLTIFVLGITSLVVAYMEYFFISTIRKAKSEKHYF